MVATMENPPPPTAPLSNRQMKPIHGYYCKFMPIPLIEADTRWFDAGPVSIAVEARCLGDEKLMLRGPSIHVFNAERTEEYLRFDIFGKHSHYHFILNDVFHNIDWSYDYATNGPMLPWTINVIRDRLPFLLREVRADALATEVETSGWDSTVLTEVEQVAADALKPCDDDLDRAKRGMDWMYEWKKVHPQFNTVEDFD